MGTKQAKRYTFTIEIGDWSDDGHGKHVPYTVTAAKPIKATREAYFAAVAKHPRCNPENFCDEYEDGEVDDDQWAALSDVGCPLPDERDSFDADAMAAVVVWFLNEGDPTLDARLDEKSRTPTLHFYGYDEKKRHIGFIGYGLLS